MQHIESEIQMQEFIRKSKKLSLVDRAQVILYFKWGFSVEEIAEVLGKDPEKVSLSLKESIIQLSE